MQVAKESAEFMISVFVGLVEYSFNGSDKQHITSFTREIRRTWVERPVAGEVKAFLTLLSLRTGIYRRETWCSITVAIIQASQTKRATKTAVSRARLTHALPLGAFDT